MNLQDARTDVPVSVPVYAELHARKIAPAHVLKLVKANVLTNVAEVHVGHYAKVQAKNTK